MYMCKSKKGGYCKQSLLGFSSNFDFLGGELTFSTAWGGKFLARKWDFQILPGGGTDPG